MAAPLSKCLGIEPGLDADGEYQETLCEFADEFGWTRGMICYWWSQIAMARMWTGQSQEVAEDGAMRDVFLAFRFLKVGNGEPD
jgi:hypothetical protein